MFFLTVIHVGSVSNRSQGVTEEQKKKNGQQRQQLLKFMTDHQPHVVCVGASNYNCRQLKDDIYEVLFCLICGYIYKFISSHIRTCNMFLPDLYSRTCTKVFKLAVGPRLMSFILPCCCTIRPLYEQGVIVSICRGFIASGFIVLLSPEFTVLLHNIVSGYQLLSLLHTVFIIIIMVLLLS